MSLLIRQDSLEEWNKYNPVLLKGELIAVTDTKPYSYITGNGTSTFKELFKDQYPQVNNNYAQPLNWIGYATTTTNK